MPAMCSKQANKFHTYENKSKISFSVSLFDKMHDFENEFVNVKFSEMVYNIKKVEKSCHLY